MGPSHLIQFELDVDTASVKTGISEVAYCITYLAGGEIEKIVN